MHVAVTVAGRVLFLLGLLHDGGLGGEHSAAIDAAFCSAERVTLAGSMIPAFTMSTHSPVAALKPLSDSARICWTITAPS